MHDGPILLTGATGYIGSRLLRELEAGGCAVRCPARQPARVAANRATTEVVTGDCLDAASLDAAMTGVDQAFYAGAARRRRGAGRFRAYAPLR